MKVKEKLIRQARQKKEYSQEYVADVLGISQSQYSKLENGETEFDINQLGILLDKLELNPLEVIEFSEKQQVFINAHNNVVNNAGEINSPLISNDIEVIRKIVKDEISKYKI